MQQTSGRAALRVCCEALEAAFQCRGVWFHGVACVCLALPHCPSFSVWPLQVIHDFLFSLKESPEKFQIEANFPRRVLPCTPSEEWPNPPTLQEAGLSHTEVLFVQDLTDE